MARKGNIHDFLERTNLPVYVVIFFVLVAGVYVITGGFGTSNSGAATTSNAPASNAAAQPAQSSQSAQFTPASANIYVENTGALPSSIAAGTIVPFSFGIQNTSDTSAQFPYKVS